MSYVAMTTAMYLPSHHTEALCMCKNLMYKFCSHMKCVETRKSIICLFWSYRIAGNFRKADQTPARENLFPRKFLPPKISC